MIHEVDNQINKIATHNCSTMLNEVKSQNQFENLREIIRSQKISLVL
jgi:hypothetical protein